MKDQQFGELKWRDDHWEGQAQFPAIATWGRALDQEDPPDDRPAGPADRSPTRAQTEARQQVEDLAQQVDGPAAAMLKSILQMTAASAEPAAPPAVPPAAESQVQASLAWTGTCELQIDTAGRRSKPTAAQRAAWAAVIERGDALWEDLLRDAFAAYQRQRPIRRRWWQAIYGDYLIDRRFPEVTTPQQFTVLIRPSILRIKALPDAKQAGMPDIALLLRATWDVDGVGVVIRNGQIQELAQVLDVLIAPPTPPPTIEHPVFGPLRRIASDDPMELINAWQEPQAGGSGFATARPAARPWLGRTHFDPLLEFASVSDSRARYVNDPEMADYPASRMAWEFAEGEFELRVHAPAGQPPAPAQAEAWKAFKAAEQRHADTLIDAIFERYQQTRQTLRGNWMDRYVDENIPLLTDAGGLRDLLQLRHIHLHWPDAAGRVVIAFQFVTNFDLDGMSILWCNGKIERWGDWKAAESGDLQ